MVFDLKDLTVYSGGITYTNNTVPEKPELSVTGLLIYSFNNHFLSTYYVPGAMLDSEHIKKVESQSWPVSS